VEAVASFQVTLGGHKHLLDDIVPYHMTPHILCSHDPTLCSHDLTLCSHDPHTVLT